MANSSPPPCPKFNGILCGVLGLPVNPGPRPPGAAGDQEEISQSWVIPYWPRRWPFGAGNLVGCPRESALLGRVHCSLRAAKFLLVACCSQEVSGQREATGPVQRRECQTGFGRSRYPLQHARKQDTKVGARGGSDSSLPIRDLSQSRVAGIDPTTIARRQKRLGQKIQPSSRPSIVPSSSATARVRRIQSDTRGMREY